MKRLYLLILMLAILTSGCGKVNPIEGTTWESTSSHFCQWENSNLNGDYSEVLSFQEDRVISKTLKDGHTYRNNGSFKYEYVKKDSGKDVVCIHDYYSKDTAADFYYYGDRIVYGILTVFYKQ